MCVHACVCVFVEVLVCTCVCVHVCNADPVDILIQSIAMTFIRLVFKHRVMVKAKLGRSVHMDIQKFKVTFYLYTNHCAIVGRSNQQYIINDYLL